MVKYGEFIKYHRQASGFKSQRQLAEKTGISSATISRIESEIQKPNPETLKELANYLKSTTFVELMVVCGYWNDEELLEVDPAMKMFALYDAYQSVKKQETNIDNKKNEEELLKKIDLTDEDLLKQFDLKIDGRSLTKEESKGIIAYVRSLRQM